MSSSQHATKLHLAQSPLILALVQVQFSSVLAMKDYLPEIQEALRHDYPDHKQSVVQGFRFEPDTGIAEVQRDVRWLLRDPAGQVAVVIGRDFLVFQTSQYQSFENFVAGFGRVLEVIGRIVGPDLCERVGLRYVNRIVPTGEEKIASYLADGLAGLSSDDLSEEDLQFGPTLSRYEARSITKVGGTLVIRALESPPGEFQMPPGLDHGDVKVASELSERASLLLDIDHYTVARSPFEVSTILESLANLHSYCELAFLKSTSESAMRLWGRKNG